MTNNCSEMRKALEKIRYEVEFYIFDEPEVDSHEKFVDSFTENPPDYVSLRNTLFEIDRILRDYGIIPSAKTPEENQGVS